jgi:hypothetical protein
LCGREEGTKKVFLFKFGAGGPERSQEAFAYVTKRRPEDLIPKKKLQVRDIIAFARWSSTFRRREKPE